MFAARTHDIQQFFPELCGWAISWKGQFDALHKNHPEQRGEQQGPEEPGLSADEWKHESRCDGTVAEDRGVGPEGITFSPGGEIEDEAYINIECQHECGCDRAGQRHRQPQPPTHGEVFLRDEFVGVSQGSRRMQRKGTGRVGGR